MLPVVIEIYNGLEPCTRSGTRGCSSLGALYIRNPLNVEWLQVNKADVFPVWTLYTHLYGKY
jgi:hypothetical protein